MSTILSNDLINATMTTIDTLADVVVVASLVANNTTSIDGIATATIFAAAAAEPVCEACGWLAAIGSMIAFGSFGVPIKSEACQRVQVDPLVFQSYKTIMCFLTSWIILLFGTLCCMRCSHSSSSSNTETALRLFKSRRLMFPSPADIRL